MAQTVPINEGPTKNDADSLHSNKGETHLQGSQAAAGQVLLPHRAPAESTSQGSNIDPPLPISVGVNREAVSAGDFPYPDAFQKAVTSERELRMQNQSRAADEGTQRVGSDDGAAGTRPKILIQSYSSHPIMTGTEKTENENGVDNGNGGRRVRVVNVRGGGLECGWFGISWDLQKEADFIEHLTYVVIGIFRHGHLHPHERVVFVHKPEYLFPKLHWAIYRLRGIRGIQACDAEKGTHERVELDSTGEADLQRLLNVYKKWYVSPLTAYPWADWIHRTFNNESNDVTKGTYALEVVIGWSMARISIVVVLPVFLSLAIGLYLNAQN
ncbi:hypothetical protein GGR58DRAFT_508365 [Xylaria digitata]|nr:hypothetical protein GGR58DRAFT_508365 [Xylaria digitata]